MVGGAVGRHRMMQTRTSLGFAKDSGKKKKTPLLHSLCSAVLVCLDSTRFVRDGMTTFSTSLLSRRMRRATKSATESGGVTDLRGIMKSMSRSQMLKAGLRRSTIAAQPIVARLAPSKGRGAV